MQVMNMSPHNFR